jgi:molybdate transport system substrate-binding protein
MFSLEYRRKTGLRRTLRHLRLPALMLAVLCTSLGISALAQQLHVAAAADLEPVLPRLAAAYQQQTGVQIIATFGSSATLAQQLTNGAPQDIFLSADTAHPQQLIAAGLATGLHGASSPTPYAHGTLVLWARHDSPAQPLSLDVLTSPKITRIAIANPQHAPYGLAAQRALESLHLAQAVQSKLVVAENIAQTAQFAESGNAQVGFLSMTTANTEHYRALGSFIRLPADSYPPLVQAGVILRASKQQAAAEAFLAWLTSAAVQQQLPGYGLDPAKP